MKRDNIIKLVLAAAILILAVVIYRRYRQTRSLKKAVQMELDEMRKGIKKLIDSGRHGLGDVHDELIRLQGALLQEDSLIVQRLKDLASRLENIGRENYSHDKDAQQALHEMGHVCADMAHDLQEQANGNGKEDFSFYYPYYYYSAGYSRRPYYNFMYYRRPYYYPYYYYRPYYYWRAYSY